MKKTILFFFFLQLIQLQAAERWQHYFGGDSYDAVNKIISISGGGWITAGYTESYGDSGYNVHVTKWDINGKMIWQNVIGHHKDDYGYSAAQDVAGNIYVAGKTNSAGSAGGFDMYLIKLNSSGTLLWERTFGGTDDDFAKAVLVNSSNEILLAGGTESFGTGGSDLWLVCTDSSGTILWSKTFGSTGEEYANAISHVHDGGYIVAGLTTGFSNNHGYVVRTDSNGDSLWTNAFSIGIIGGAMIYDVTELTDTAFVYTGYGDDYSYGNMFHMKTDLAGGLIYRKYSSLLADAGYGITSNADSGYTIAGVTSNFGSRPILTKFTSAGDKVWERVCYYNNSGTYSLYTYGISLVQNNDGSYTIGGVSGLNNTCNSYYDSFIMKTDNSGFSTPLLALPITTTTGSNFCDTASVNATLVAPPGYSAYQWFYLIGGMNVRIDGAVFQNYNTTVPGTFFCLLTTDDEMYYSQQLVVSVTTVINQPITNPAGVARFCSITGQLPYVTTASIPGLNYQWYINGVLIPGATSNVIHPTLTGQYTVSVFNNCGSQTSLPVVVYTASGPQNVIITPSGPTNECYDANQRTHLTSSITTYSNTYTWLLNGTIISGNTSYAYTPDTSGNYSLVVSNDCGVDTSNIITMNVNAAPVAVLTSSINSALSVYNGSYYCGYDTLYAPSNINGNATYIWKLNGAILFTNYSPSHWINQPGNYTVEIINVCGSTVSAPITVNAIQGDSVTVANDNACTVAKLTAPLSSNYNYQWYLNNNPITFATSYYINVISAGNYYCTFQPDGCSSAIPSNTVTVGTSVGRPNMSASPSLNVCTGTVLLNVSTLNATYTWKRNGSTIPGATNQSYTTTQTGIYVCMVSLPGCSDDSAQAYVIVGTVGIVSQSQYVCFQNGTYLGPEVPHNYYSVSYQWRLNGNSISGATDASYHANQAGTYDLSITDSCGTYLTNSITLISPPSSITPSGTIRICDGSSVILTAPSGPGFTYSWKIYGSYISGATDSTFTAGPDNLCCSPSYVGVEIKLPGCYSNYTFYDTLIIASGLTNNIYASTSPEWCGNGSVVLNARISNGLTYQWYKDSVAIPLATDTAYTATTTGAYYVNISDSLGCSNNSNVIQVNEFNLEGTINKDSGQTLCGGTTILSVDPAANNYQWYYNGSMLSGATLQSYQADSSGVYDVVYSDASGCSGTSSTTVLVIYPAHTHVTYTAQHFCAGDSALLTGGTSYAQWYLNGVMIPGATSYGYYATTTGDYSLVGFDYNGCKVAISDTVTIYFDTIQFANISSTSTSLCPNNLVTLTSNNGGNSTYQWKRDGIDIPGATFMVYDVIASGSYTCEVSGTCGTAISNQVVITSAFIVSISANGSTNICNGGNVTLSASPTGTQYIYQWIENGFTIPNAIEDTFVASASGIFEVQVTDTTGCQNISIGISVLEIVPDVNLGPDTILCVNQSIILDAGSGFDIYNWQDGSTSEMFTASSSLADTIIYSVSVTDTNGCSTSDSIQVIYDICSGINFMESETIIFYPNPAHEKLTIVSQETKILRLRIIDMLGEEWFSEASGNYGTEIDLSIMGPGIYFLEIQTSGRRFIKKFTKQ